MRIDIMNKAAKTENKAAKTANKAGNPGTDFHKMAAEVVKAIGGKCPVAFDETEKKLKMAKDDVKAAQTGRELAQTEEEFYKYRAMEREARERVEFYSKQIDRLNAAPLMDEAVYDTILEGIDNEVKEAAEVFYKRMCTAMDELVEAKNEYVAVLNKADNTVIPLDRAARVMQYRHRERIERRQGVAEKRVKDPNEWLKFAHRYGMQNYRSIGAKFGHAEEWAVKFGLNAATRYENSQKKGGIA